jgi:hypothetical protein
VWCDIIAPEIANQISSQQAPYMQKRIDMGNEHRNNKPPLILPKHIPELLHLSPTHTNNGKQHSTETHRALTKKAGQKRTHHRHKIGTPKMQPTWNHPKTKYIRRQMKHVRMAQRIKTVTDDSVIGKRKLRQAQPTHHKKQADENLRQRVLHPNSNFLTP